MLDAEHLAGASVRAPSYGADVDVSRALERMQRTRKRQPRWWKAAEEANINAIARASLRALADAIEKGLGQH